MELISLHLCMEIFAAGCLLFVGGMNIYHDTSGKYSNIIAAGCIIAAIAEFMHGIIPYIHPHSVEMGWMAISGSTSRSVLTITLLIVLFCYNKTKCCIPYIITLLLIPVILSIVPLFIQLDLSWSYIPIELFWITITRPIDVGLMFMWIFLTFALKNKAKFLFPPHTFILFMTLGILIHALLGFFVSKDFDSITFLAHALKISEYYSFILIYLIYNLNYHNTKSLIITNHIDK